MFQEALQNAVLSENLPINTKSHKAAFQAGSKAFLGIQKILLQVRVALKHWLNGSSERFEKVEVMEKNNPAAVKTKVP